MRISLLHIVAINFVGDIVNPTALGTASTHVDPKLVLLDPIIANASFSLSISFRNGDFPLLVLFHAEYVGAWESLWYLSSKEF